MAAYVESGGRATHIYVSDDPRKQGVLADEVTSIQCDGHELEVALSLTGRPFRRSVMRFYGDEAKFIVGNWKG